MFRALRRDLAEDQHMQAARSMRAPHDGLLDIGRPRRAADQVDAARQRTVAIVARSRSQASS